MADIQTYLDYILSKIYGKDVRQAIVDAINQCYADATEGITPQIDFEEITNGTRVIVTVGSISKSFDVISPSVDVSKEGAVTTVTFTDADGTHTATINDGVRPQVATASTASAMTDTSLIYVYTGSGSETGYTNGNWYYHNGSTWVSGGVYNATALVTDKTLSNEGEAADAKVVGTEISELKNILNTNNGVMLADSVPTKYVFELGAIAGGTGVESDSTVRARTTVFMPYLNDEYIVEIGSDYTCSVIYYDSNQTFMIGHWWYTGTYVVKGYSRAEIQNTKYIKIVIKRTDDGDIDINDLNANVKIGRKVNAPRTYTVNPSGGADFTSLVDAIYVAEQHMDSTVYLENGVYDLLSDLGSTYINSVDASNRGIYLKNRIRLVGSGDTLITCLYDGSRELTAKWLAIFNAGEYGFTLENLRLSGKNIRYVIHDERDSDEDFYVNKYINCRMVFDNAENQYSNAVQCIGGGLGLHGVIVVEDCYFNSINAQNVAFPAVSYHNSADASEKNGQSLIFVSNSFFENNNTIRINYYGKSTKITQALIYGNSLGRDVIFGAETSDGSSPNVNININKFNNIVRQNPVITAILGTLDSGFTSAERCMNLVNVSLMIQGVNVGTSWTDVAYISVPPTKNQLFTVYDHTNYEALEGYILAGTGHIYMRAKQALSNCSVRAGFSYSIA